MFDYLKRKEAPKASSEFMLAPQSEFSSLEKLPGVELLKTLHGLVTRQHVDISELFFFTLETSPTPCDFFCSQGDEKSYPDTLEGWMTFLAELHNGFSGSVSDDEIGKQKLFYYHLSRLMMQAREFVDRNPKFSDEYTDIWIELLEGCHTARETLRRILLLNRDFTAYFDEIKNDRDGEDYVMALMMLGNIRYHSKIRDWEERHLSQAIRDKLDMIEIELKKLKTNGNTDQQARV